MVSRPELTEALSVSIRLVKQEFRASQQLWQDPSRHENILAHPIFTQFDTWMSEGDSRFDEMADAVAHFVQTYEDLDVVNHWTRMVLTSLAFQCNSWLFWVLRVANPDRMVECDPTYA